MRDKLLISLHKSLLHRMTALPDSLGLCRTVIGRLKDMTDNGRLEAATIALVTYETLRRFDAAAATMYQAYHASSLQV